MDTFLDNMRRGNNVDDPEDAAEEAIVDDNRRLVNYIRLKIESSDMEIRKWALKCGATFSLLCQESAKDVFIASVQQLTDHVDKDVWIASIEAVFELIVCYGFAYFDNDNNTEVIQKLKANLNTATQSGDNREECNNTVNDEGENYDKSVDYIVNKGKRFPGNANALIRLFGDLIGTWSDSRLIRAVNDGFGLLTTHGMYDNGKVVSHLAVVDNMDRGRKCVTQTDESRTEQAASAEVEAEHTAPTNHVELFHVCNEETSDVDVSPQEFGVVASAPKMIRNSGDPAPEQSKLSDIERAPVYIYRIHLLELFHPVTKSVKFTSIREGFFGQSKSKTVEQYNSIVSKGKSGKHLNAYTMTEKNTDDLWNLVVAHIANGKIAEGRLHRVETELGKTAGLREQLEAHLSKRFSPEDQFKGDYRPNLLRSHNSLLVETFFATYYKPFLLVSSKPLPQFYRCVNVGWDVLTILLHSEAAVTDKSEEVFLALFRDTNEMAHKVDAACVELLRRCRRSAAVEMESNENRDMQKPKMGRKPGVVKYKEDFNVTKLHQYRATAAEGQEFEKPTIEWNSEAVNALLPVTRKRKNQKRHSDADHRAPRSVSKRKTLCGDILTQMEDVEPSSDEAATSIGNIGNGELAINELIEANMQPIVVIEKLLIPVTDVARTDQWTTPEPATPQGEALSSEFEEPEELVVEPDVVFMYVDEDCRAPPTGRKCETLCAATYIGNAATRQGEAEETNVRA